MDRWRSLGRVVASAPDKKKISRADNAFIASLSVLGLSDCSKLRSWVRGTVNRLQIDSWYAALEVLSSPG